MTTLGVSVIAGTLTLASLFMRSQEALLLQQEEFERLTLVAQEAMLQRQHYLDLATDWLPVFVVAGCLMGLTLAATGLLGWLKRQRIADELEDIEVKKGNAELRRMSDRERIEKAERDALDDITGEAPPPDSSPAPPSQPKQSAPAGAPATDIRSRARSAMNANMQAELSVASKLEQALGESYVVDIGFEVRGERQGRYIDVLARPTDTDAQWFVFEIKRLPSLSFVKNYKARITEAITQAVMVANTLPHEKITPVAVVTFDDADPEYLPQARDYGDALAASFATGPVFLLIKFSDLEQMSPTDFAARIGAANS